MPLSRARSLRLQSKARIKYKRPSEDRLNSMSLSTRSSKARRKGITPKYSESTRTSDIDSPEAAGDDDAEGSGSGDEYMPQTLATKRRNHIQISPTPSEDVVMQPVQVSKKGRASVSGVASEDEQLAEDDEEIVENDVYDVEEEEPPDDDMVIEEEDDYDDENIVAVVSPSNASSKGLTTKGKPTPTKRCLTIRLRFPVVASADPTPTPSDEMPTRSGRRTNARRVEESDSESDESTSSRSPSVAPPTRMTQRQAARARGENAELLVLDETSSRRKKELNEAELALKREENARKRKNLTEKKLEDEKTETINRLLKRQSRPRGKKARVVDPDEEGEEGDEEAFTAAPTPPEVPTMYRWISTSKQNCPALSFSVPPSLLPQPEAMPKTVAQPPPIAKPICDVRGCSQPRKYKLVKDPTRGGCGMEHLKALQVAMA